MRWRAHELALVLATELLDLEDLHFGLFEPGEEPTTETLRVAQQRYTDRVLSLLPEDAGRILDVGCGTGKILARLKAEGREVEGLAPNPDLITKARELLGPDVPLHDTAFETFRTDRPFDAILMAESFQYLHRVRGLKAAAAALKPGGTLIIADVFRTKPIPAPHLSRGGHRRDVFVSSARNLGFEVELEEDVTEAILPTLALYHELLTKKAVPAADAAARFFTRTSPLITRVVRLFLGRRLKLLRNRYLHQDPETFRTYRAYLLFRLRRS